LLFGKNNQDPETGCSTGNPPDGAHYEAVGPADYVLFGVLGSLLALAGAAYLVPRREAVTVAVFYERLQSG